MSEFGDEVHKVVEEVEEKVEDVFHHGEADADAVGKDVEADAKEDLETAETDVKTEVPVIEQDVEQAAKDAATDAAAEVPAVLADPGDIGKDAEKVAKEVEDQEKGDVVPLEGVLKSDVEEEEQRVKEQSAAIEKQIEINLAKQKAAAEEAAADGRPYSETPEGFANRLNIPRPDVAGNVHQV